MLLISPAALMAAIRTGWLALSLILLTPTSWAAERAAAHDAEWIYNVMEARLTCGESTSVLTVVHPQREQVKHSGILPVGDLAYQVALKRITEFREWTVAVTLHDRSRGVDDSYVLFTRTGLSPFKAAYVITRLPESMTGDEAMQIALSLQKGNAGTGRASFIETDTPFGRGVEMIVGGRVGSVCFPTSHFQYAESAEAGSIGISRFVLKGRDMIEYALVLPWSENEPQAEAITRSQARMNAFQEGLRALDMEKAK